MTIFYKCENCDHVSDDINEIDIMDWVSRQDPTDVYGLPGGTCTECGAPVYEQGTFDKLDAARAMLAALHSSLSYVGETDATDDSPEARNVRDDIRAAITKARAAGITPTT